MEVRLSFVVKKTEMYTLRDLLQDACTLMGVSHFDLGIFGPPKSSEVIDGLF